MKTLIPYFSLIIPVYNVEKYLEQCLESIFKQTYTNYEVIVVNDGSTDNSLTICERYAKTHTNLILINQDNKGLSGARNVGMAKATGHYIWFVDSDDYLLKNSLEIAHQHVSAAPVDVLGFSNYHFIEETQTLRENNLNPETKILTNIDVIQQDFRFEIAPWIYIYNHTFLKKNHIQFREDIKIHEDEFYLLEVLSKLDTIKFISNRLYVYRIRPNSLMRSDRVADKLYAFSQQVYTIQHLKNSYLVDSYWEPKLMHVMNMFYTLYLNLKDKPLKQRYLKDYQSIKNIRLNIQKNDSFALITYKLAHNYCFYLYKTLLLS